MMVEIASRDPGDEVTVRFVLEQNPIVSPQGIELSHPYVLHYGINWKNKWNRHIFEWESVRLGEC